MSDASRAAAGPSPSPGTPAELDVAVDRLAHKLVAIETDTLRARAAADELLRLSPADAVLVVGRLLRQQRDRRHAADAAAALARALAQRLVDDEFVATCLSLARSRADRLAQAFFAAGPAHRVYDPNEEQFVDRKMRALPLGERRSLSKSRDVDLLMRLAHDQDARVIRQLLANPRVTEREAVVVASRRPTRPPVLEEVLASRFGLSRRVRRAVAQNPYAPVALASRAMASLPAAELRLVASDDKLSLAVRDVARTLLVGRRATPAEREARPRAADEAGPSDLTELLDALESGLDGEEDLTLVPIED